MTHRAALGFAVATYLGQVVVSAAVVLVTARAPSGGLADFNLYFAVGDWLGVRLPLVAAVVLTAVVMRQGIAATWLRGLSMIAGIASSTLFVGLLLWLAALRLEATEQFFPQYLSWPGPYQAVWIGLAVVSIGLGGVLFALRPDDPLRAGYFAFSFGYLGLVYASSVLALDVVSATIWWSTLAALAAAALTVARSSRRRQAFAAVVAATLGAALLYPLAFTDWGGQVRFVWNMAGPVVLCGLTLAALRPGMPGRGPD